MQRILVGFGIDRDRLDAHPARGLDDPAGDFAAVGDKYFFEHQLPMGGQRASFPLGPFLLERSEPVNNGAPRRA